jgi:hypothetical protein
LAGAEIIKRDSDAECSQLGQELFDFFFGSHHHPFGISRFSHSGCHPVAARMALMHWVR